MGQTEEQYILPNISVIISHPTNITRLNKMTAGKNCIFSIHWANGYTAKGNAVSAAVIIRKTSSEAAMRNILRNRFIQNISGNKILLTHDCKGSNFFRSGECNVNYKQQ